MLRADLGAALMLLTRVPVPWSTASDPARAVWAYPLVGAGIGGCGALVLAAAHAVDMPVLLASVWTVAALALLTGALHEDGLADVADGFGGGRTAERKLEIMRDSRVGSYGALALVLAVGVRVAALSRVPEAGSALVVAGALSRASMGVPLLLLRPAREGGLGASAGGRPAAAWLGFGIALAVALALLPFGAAAAACVGAAVSSLLLAGLARGQIGGYTGDVLGACAVIAECVVLSVLAR